MFANNGYPSVADIAAAFPNRGSDNGNGFGGDGGWWILIILLAMWGGFGGNWGNNGNGGGRTMTSDFTDAALQRGFDTQTIINKLDGINSGLCSLGYDQLAQMNTLGQSIMQTGYTIERAVQADTIANMQNTNALSTQLANCCCEQKGAIKDLQYAVAQNDCATRTQIHETGDAIIQNANWNFRDLNDTIRNEFTNLRQQQDQRYIAELERKINNSERSAEFSQWANYITNYLSPRTNPSYLACNPVTGSVIPDNVINQIAWQVSQQLGGNNGCDCNNGCYQNRCC